MVVDKLDKKKRERQTNTEYLGQTMIDAGNEFGTRYTRMVSVTYNFETIGTSRHS